MVAGIITDIIKHHCKLALSNHFTHHKITFHSCCLKTQLLASNTMYNAKIPPSIKAHTSIWPDRSRLGVVHTAGVSRLVRLFVVTNTQVGDIVAMAATHHFRPISNHDILYISITLVSFCTSLDFFVQLYMS